VNLKCTHPFDGFYQNAPIYLEGCISNLKGKKKIRDMCKMGGGGEGVFGTNYIYLLINVEVF
jgi:hypothetical protein